MHCTSFSALSLLRTSFGWSVAHDIIVQSQSTSMSGLRGPSTSPLGIDGRVLIFKGEKLKVSEVTGQGQADQWETRTRPDCDGRTFSSVQDCVFPQGELLEVSVRFFPLSLSFLYKDGERRFLWKLDLF